MASKKEIVVFDGIIRGGGHEAACKVSATKVSLPGNVVPPAYAKYSVKVVSKQLPSGQYQLFVNGQCFAMRNQDGNWLSGDPD